MNKLMVVTFYKGVEEEQERTKATAKPECAVLFGVFFLVFGRPAKLDEILSETPDLVAKVPV